MIRVDTRFIENHYIEKEEILAIQPQVELASDLLRSHTGPGKDMLGWLTWAEECGEDLLSSIQQAAQHIQNQASVLIVIGIGGSFLGAKAAIDFLSSSQYTSSTEGQLEVLFAGTDLSASSLNDLLAYVNDKDFAINVISKSGTTTEPSIAYRILKNKLVEKYGEESKDRIYITTDEQLGALRKEATTEGYTSFTIPDDIGGRFTVLTPVGLLPVAAAGHDIKLMIQGAADYATECRNASFTNNSPLKYAAIRNLLYRKGYSVEVLASYEPRLRSMAEWWKQLFGESEGKNHKGIFPASAFFTRDLHSLGQYIQDGKRQLIETVLFIDSMPTDLYIPESDHPDDGLSYLEGQSLNDINEKAMKGTLLAHSKGGVPVLLIRIDQVSEYDLGQLFFFFEMAVAISGYVNAVNPFDQPGVEEYKKNMFALLGKPGYEELAQDLNEEMDGL